MNFEDRKVHFSTLRKYFEGQASNEELALVTEWLRDGEDSSKLKK